MLVLAVDVERGAGVLKAGGVDAAHKARDLAQAGRLLGVGVQLPERVDDDAEDNVEPADAHDEVKGEVEQGAAAGVGPRAVEQLEKADALARDALVDHGHKALEERGAVGRRRVGRRRVKAAAVKGERRRRRCR